MNASHEAPKLKPMPFIRDASLISPESPVAAPQDGDARQPTISSGLLRPRRTQSTTAILHHPLRLPPTVPENSVVPSVQDHETHAASPRRARANTGVTKPRGSLERPPEEDANWWTEEIHKRREIRRRWKEVEDENTVIIGKKVDTNHPNYVTAYNMLTGLRVAVRAPSQIFKAYF
jgi:hypothetical protein